jgi:hypothetical protein
MGYRICWLGNQVMSFIADMQSVLRLAIRILVILCVILIVVIYGGREAQKVIAKAAQEKRNQTEQVASENQKKDAQHKQEMERLRELSKSAIDDKQRRLDAMKSDHDIEPEPLKERFEDLSQIANSSTGYKKLVWEGLSEAMKEFSVLGQEYQKAASGVAEFTKHDLQQLSKGSVPTNKHC